jgi:hypothetical protein
MTKVKVRVKDHICDEDGNPVLHPETGAPLRNHIAYFVGGVSYYPGEVFEMDTEEAARAMRVANPARPPILEPAHLQEDREQRRRAAEELRRNEGRNAIAKEAKKLAEQAMAALRIRRMADERDFSKSVENAPMAVVQQVIDRLGGAVDRKEEEVEAARAEVPAGVMERMERMERENMAMRQELDRLRSSEKKRGGKDAGA